MSNEVEKDKDFKDEILREQVRLAMKQVPTMQVTSFIVALVLSYVVRDIVPHVNIFAWVLTILTIVVSRIVLCYRFRKLREGAFAGAYWRKIYLILALISGIIWGLSAFVVFPARNPALISLFVLVIASLSAATTVSHSSIKWGPTAWAGPAMSLYAIRCVVEGGQFGYTIGFLSILYLFTILRYSFDHNNSITSAIALGFENLELLKEVQKVNDILRQEISERKQAEERLRRSEANLQVILEATADGILAVDDKRKIIKVNRRFADLWRIPQSVLNTGEDDAMLNFVLDQLVDPDSFLKKVRSLYGTAEFDTDVLFFKDGRVFDRFSAPLMQEGSIIGRVWSFRDATERKRAEAERLEMERRLLHAQKLESLGVLAGGIAHDFNNLLMAILGNLDLTLMDLPQGSPARSKIEQAIHATRRAADLTRQMLAYSGKGPFVISRMNLSDLVRDNADLFRTAIARTISLDLSLSSQPSTIEADPGQVQQVIMNLITNASEAIGEKPGVITLSSGVMEGDDRYLSRSMIDKKPPAGRFAYVEVSDTGCGMNEETQRRLFDPFFTTKFPGRGLGMSVVLGVVRGHKGAILLESAVGRGTTIRVLFPACEGEGAAPAEVSSVSPSKP
ncbi:MAG TPA: ATP-binding protein, partial [Syntrophobacteria bacterium]|nr:ATP-binding protein [Syntrophobacteria bacterium]